MFKNLLLIAAVSHAAEFYSVKEAIDGSYIVVLKKGLDMKATLAHKEFMTNFAVNITRELSFGSFNAYSASTSKQGLEALLGADEVKYVEQNGVIRASECETQRNAPWGLNRVSSRDLPADDYVRNTDFDGDGVYAYVLDTGIYLAHDDFGGRAIFGANMADNNDDDGNGHGTHCAGTIGGNLYGLAKKVILVAVKVLDDSGSGSFDGVIAGIAWSATDRAGRGRPGVGSMSLGGGFSNAVNDAVNAADDDDLTIVVASGNENQDACNVSPASAAQAITVNAIDANDRRSSFSNFGTCSDIFAPGSNVLSAWIGGPTSSRSISGTSMACPHVAGQVAKYLSKFPNAGTSDVKAHIMDSATMDMIVDPGTNSPNRLLYGFDCVTDSPITAPPTPPTPPTPAPTPLPTNSCDTVPVPDRFSCSTRTIVNEADCLAAAEDCCWSQEPITAIWCYKPPNAVTGL